MKFLNMSLTKPTLSLVLMLFASQIFAAGDYVREAIFAKTLPKAEQGDVEAQYDIGEMYEKGRGTNINAEEAFKWFVKAASKGDKKAAFKVGLYYYEGTAVSKDYQKAQKWLSKSADQKYVRAEYYLGEMYEYGRGVSRDLDTALVWYKRALAGGYATASEGIVRVAAAQSDIKKRAELKARPTVTASPSPQTIERILKGGWTKRKKPVEYLPSSVTECKRKINNIECESSLLTRNIGMADISYTTKAIIFGIKHDGRFKISYRNNVKTIKVTDESFAEEGGKVPVKLGWQDAEHELVCNVENDNNISCTKNKMRSFKLTR